MVRSDSASKTDPRVKIAFHIMAGVLAVLVAQPLAAAVPGATDAAAMTDLRLLGDLRR